MAGRLLVVDGDGANPVLRLERRIQEADIAVPAEAEQIRHLLADQEIDDDIGAVHHGAFGLSIACGLR